MSHHCLNHFMDQTHTMSHTSITTNTGSRKRPQALNTRMHMSCLLSAVSHKLSPQYMTADSRSSTSTSASHQSCPQADVSTVKDVSGHNCIAEQPKYANTHYCMKQPGGMRSQSEGIQQNLTSQGCASARCHQHLQHKAPRKYALYLLTAS